jgi:hypothetical protein
VGEVNSKRIIVLLHSGHWYVFRNLVQAPFSYDDFIQGTLVNGAEATIPLRNVLAIEAYRTQLSYEKRRNQLLLINNKVRGTGDE